MGPDKQEEYAIYCPTCDDMVQPPSLSDEECYLVAKPQ
jgi:hypothetical protein